MPNVSEVVVETKQSILRPVVLDIVRQVRDLTRIPVTTPILYPDDIGKTYQPGSAITEDPEEKILFPYNDKIIIEIEEEYDPANVLSTAVTQPEHLPIFHDKEIGIFIKPVYVSTNVSINFKYKCKSKTMANRWRDDIRMRTSMSRDINLHQVSYHFIVPGAFLAILREIHKLRETQGSYDEEFLTYFFNNSTTRLTEVTNQAGSNIQPAIAETQMRIVGYFDFNSEPEKIENADDTDGWVGNFTYKFKFDKPIACNMRYPVMIHNQVLSTKFRPAEKSYNIEDHIKTYSQSMSALHHFESQLQVQKYVNLNATITIPEYDEFIPNAIPTGTVSVFNALCQLTSDDLRSLLNLQELDTIAIDADIMEFIQKSEYPFMTKPYKSILKLDLYRSTSLAREDSIVLTSDFNVKATTDLSIRTSHRIRFSIVADISYLDQAALERLKRYPKAFVKILSTVNEALRNNPGFSDLTYKGRLTKDDLSRYLTFPLSANARDRLNQRVQFNTVQFSNVVALRADRLPK